MIAKGMKEAGVSMGDVTWLKSMRNSSVSRTTAYRNVQQRVREQVRTFLNSQNAHPHAA